MNIVKTKKFWLWASIFLAVTAVATGFFRLGFNIGRQDLADKISQETWESHEGGYRFINPLLECQAPVSYTSTMSRLEKVLSDIINQVSRDGRVSHVSVYLRDLNNGPWIGINEKEKFSPASLMKVPIMISYFKAAESDPSLLKRKIKISPQPSNILPQNIISRKQVSVGEEYSVEDLIERMIKYSDNLAVDALVENGGYEFMARTYRDLDLALPAPNEENYITVRDYAGFFRILYNASYLSHEMSERALSLLSETDFRDGIVAGVPSYVTVAHKFGERRLEDSAQLHDCGIVYRSASPYLLCIMTRGKDFTEMEKVIGTLSASLFAQY